MTTILRHLTPPRSMAQGREGAARRNVAILWLRHDLRIQDNISLMTACFGSPHRLVPASFLDPKLLQPRTNVPELTSLPTMGPHRLRFYLEALHDLQGSLAARGSGLHFSLCSPTEGISRLTQQLSADASELQLFHSVYSGPARVAEEDAVAAAFTEAAGSVPSSIHASWDHTLYHPQEVLQALAQQKSSRKKSKKKHVDTRVAATEAPVPRGSPVIPAKQLTRDTSIFDAVPGVMSDFRKAMEEFGDVEDPESAPRSIPPLPEGLESSSIPSPDDALELYELAGAADALKGLQQLTGFDARCAGDSRRDVRSAMPFAGGESAGQERLRDIFHGKQDTNSSSLPGSSFLAEASEQHSDHAQTSEQGTEQEQQSVQGDRLETTQTHTKQDNDTPADNGAERQAPSGQPGSAQGGSAGGQDDVEALIHSFKDMRMMASGVDNSAKLSAYLAAGCLSPREVYWEARNAAEQHGSDTGHSTLIMHLVIRDFFLFTAVKEGDKLTRPEGLKEEAPPASHSPEAFQRWCRGQTGFPFVDACMRELCTTGYMSNRGRQNVSSFLCKAMQQYWWLGAAVFEALLVDHDWAVNTVNWAYFAGVGNDPRDRVFRTVSQGETYDPDAALIKAWVPELGQLPTEYAHKPWELESDEAEKHGFDLNRDYCAPVLDASTQVARNYGKQRT